MKFNQHTEIDMTDVIIGCHSVGNWGPRHLTLYYFL